MQLRSSLHAALFAYPLLLALAACGGDSAKPPAFTERDELLVDAQGREVIFHGINARIEGLFDVTFDDGRTALEPIPPFTEEDCRFIGEDLGLNHLRLLVNWSAIEPHDDDFREDYLQRALDVAAMCERHGVYSIVDIHQDAFSKEIGEDGAPLWAIQPPPTQLLGGPLHDLDVRRASQQVADAFLALFSGQYGGDQQFAQMAAWVAERIEGKPGIVGLELFNEPMAYFDTETLMLFHTTVATSVRAAAPRLPIFFEPAAERNVTDYDPVTALFPFDDAIYSPHMYCDVFEDGWINEDVAKLEGSIARARVEASMHGAALYFGEFGNGDNAVGSHYISEAERAFDETNASWAFWLYEEWSQGNWGLYESAPAGRGALRQARADLLARAFPAAIAGHVESFTYDVPTKMLTVNVTANRAGEHVISVPTRTFPNGVTVHCGANVVAADVSAGRARFRCASTPIVVEPAP